MSPLPEPSRIANDLRALRLIWVAIAVGVVAFTAVFAFLIATGAMQPAVDADTAFYLAAGFSVVTILAGFFVQRRLTDTVLPAADSYERAVAAVRIHGIMSIAVLEAGALIGGVLAMVSATMTPLAFVVPFFAFWWLFFPSEQRLLYLLSRTSGLL
ncbi:MAG TPA: hypothetical protein VK610_03095 [Rhodothermales bacterium]|nr:hypothetical protein [Rhodothermales bacterium]